MMDVVAKIEQVISLIDEIQSHDMNHLSKKDAVKGNLKDLEHQYSLCLTNDPSKAAHIKKDMDKLKDMLMRLDNYSKSKYQLVEALDNFLCDQSAFYPNKDFKYKMSILDLTHPMRKWNSVNDSIKIIRSVMKHLSMDETAQFLNETCHLTGHKRLRAILDTYGSKECPDIGHILDAALKKDGFWLIKKTLRNNDFVDDHKIKPIKLLKRLVAYYNKRTKSIADTSKRK